MGAFMIKDSQAELDNVRTYLSGDLETDPRAPTRHERNFPF